MAGPKLNLGHLPPEPVFLASALYAPAYKKQQAVAQIQSHPPSHTRQVIKWKFLSLDSPWTPTDTLFIASS